MTACGDSRSTRSPGRRRMLSRGLARDDAPDRRNSARVVRLRGSARRRPNVSSAVYAVRTPDTVRGMSARSRSSKARC